MDYWQATIRTWPFSTEAGATEDRKAVGDELQTFEIVAEDFREAYEKADLIVTGIKCNPRVWQSHIVQVALKRINVTAV